MTRAFATSSRAVSFAAMLCGVSLLVLARSSGPATATEGTGEHPTTPPAPTLDVAALGVGAEAEIAIYDVSVEGDERRLEAVSILSAPPAAHRDRPTLRWQVYSEGFESPKKAYHVRFVSFADLDARDLTPLRVTHSFLSWEGGGCCYPSERDDDGRLAPASSLPALDVGPGRVLPWQVPLLVRAIELPDAGPVKVEVLRRDGETVPAEIERVGREPWRGSEGDPPVEAEKIVVRYARLDPLVALDALMLSTGAEKETYWREVGGHRRLLAMESAVYGVPMTMRLREDARREIPPTSAASRATAPRTRPAPSAEPDAEETARPLRLDGELLSSPVWDDGQAELAFYAREDGGGEVAVDQDRLALSILVKHHYDPVHGRKVGDDDPAGVATFLTLWIGAFDDPGSPVPIRRFLSVQARQDDLRPFDASVAEVTAHDQCGALANLAPGEPEEDHLSCHVRQPPPPSAGDGTQGAFPTQEMPLLVRALDLGPERALAVQELPVRLPNGRVVTASVRYAGRERVESPAGARECDRFEVSYGPPAPHRDGDALPASILGPLPATETFWREVGGVRQIVRQEAGGEALVLVEEIRARHWAEDFYPRLERVTGRP